MWPAGRTLPTSGVDGLKDPLGDSEIPQVEALLRLPHQSVDVCSPSQILCDVDSQEPEAAHPLHSTPINPQWYFEVVSS